jgi:hypothetical protein
LGKFSKEF